MLALTEIAQEQDLEPIAPITLVCCGCAEFLASERTPSVGMCLLHAVRVLVHDKACSHYYQPDPFESIGQDEEF